MYIKKHILYFIIYNMKQIIHTTDWIVVYTKPRHEYSVLNDLSKIGFDSYIYLQ